MKNRLKEYLKELSILFCYDKANAISIAQELQVSRSLISQYLNELYTMGEVIKINTRPVVFFDIKAIESHIGTKVETFEFFTREDFQLYLRKYEKSDFQKLIGYNESLHYVVERCRATISYPPNGLPILLHGATGTGKSMIAQIMYEYCINHKLIKQESQFLTLNCSEYADNPELLTANLFGYKKGAFTGAEKDNPGMIKYAEGGVLFLDEIHALKFDCQEKLFLYMDKGIYHLLGDNETWYKSNVRLIFATTEDPQKVLLKTLLRRIPMIVDIPTLADKGVNERIQLIYHLFFEEQKLLKRDICFHNKVYQVLLTSYFPGNIGDLKNCIKASCVNAYYRCQKESDCIEIHIHDLPQNLINIQEMYKNNLLGDDQNTILSIKDLQSFTSNERKQMRLHKGILSIYEKFYIKHITLADFLDESLQSIERYNEQVAFSKSTIGNSNFEYLLTIFQDIINHITARYHMNISNNDKIMLASYLFDYAKQSVELLKLCEENNDTILRLMEDLKDQLHQEYLIAEELVNNINANVEIKMNNMIVCIITLYFHKFSHSVNSSKRIAIILAHGFSTASSIADAANQLLGMHVFDAIDMPLQITSEVMIKHLHEYLDKVVDYNEIVLLVDMGSLEEIYKGIVDTCNANIGIINNVTLKMALEIGNYLGQGMELDTIFNCVEENSVPIHHIVHFHKKEYLILCSCASGLGTAEKLKKILIDSIPTTFPVKIITFEYNELLDPYVIEAISKQYEILCAVGTLNPNLKEFPFIPIEELIVDVSLDKLHSYFSKYLSIHELKEFKHNILKNFSMMNIMDTLTILNPTKLLELVSQSIDKLQVLRKETLSNITCVGLYVHVSCLIERLVTKQSIECYEEIETFSKEHKDFIDQVKEAFSYIEHYYSVNITIEEIGYIYDYIKNDHEVELLEESL